MHLNRVVKKISRFIRRNKSTIMIGLGIIGFGATIATTDKVSPIAKQKIAERKKELKVDKLPVKETIKTVAPYYIPVLVESAVSAGLIIGGTHMNNKQKAVLMTAYGMSQDALKEFKQAAIETVGDKKEKLIEDHVTEKKMLANPASTSEVIVTGNGDTMFYDAYSGRYFKSNIDKINRIVNSLNRDMNLNMSISLNDFYYENDMKQIPIGDEVGWNIEDGLIDISLNAVLDDSMNPCLSVTLIPEPKVNFI